MCRLVLIHLSCLVSVHLSTGYGPRPIALYRRFFTPTSVVSNNRFYHHCLTLRILYRIFVRHRPSSPVSERAIFSRSQEPDSPFYKASGKQEPDRLLTSGNPLHLLPFFCQCTVLELNHPWLWASIASFLSISVFPLTFPNAYIQFILHFSFISPRLFKNFLTFCSL